MEGTATTAGMAIPKAGIERSTEEVLQVLRYWEHVEKYCAPIAEDEGEHAADLTVTHVIDKDDLWTTTQDDRKSFRHFVRFGVASVGECDKYLIGCWSEVKDNTHQANGEGDKNTFAGTFAVDANGIVDKGSLVISRFLYDMRSALGDLGLTYYDYAGALSAEFKARLKSKSPPIATAWALSNTAFSLLGLPSTIRAAVECVVVTRSKPIVDGKAPRKIRDVRPSTSVYPALLRELQSDVENGVVVGAAWDLLTRPTARSDFDATSDAIVLKSLRTDRYPTARWPTDFSLSPQQQVAVNEVFSRLEKEGIFSINGPPGTGKTTLLMDVIAEIITRRADILETYDDPSCAFESSDDGSNVYRIDRTLHDFLIVVASSNNNAVENITLELPKREKLGRNFDKTVGPLQPLAQSLMDQHQVVADAWGTISAPLGNRVNRDRCAAALRDFADRYDPDETNGTRWAAARREYAAARRRVEEIKETHRRLDMLVSSATTYAVLGNKVAYAPRGGSVPLKSSSSSVAFSLDPSMANTPSVLDLAAEQIRQVVFELGHVNLPQDYLSADNHAKAEMLVGTSYALETARAELFIAAMKLHEAFVAAAWECVRANLSAWVDLTSGTVGPSLRSIAEHLWSTFSLLVPVVSSTFCSFANVFGDLDRGTIPWLIVDEAGQASSYQAIDAVSRAKRAIIVGDPFQLEPISLISNSVDRALADKFDIDPEFRCKSKSLQTLADRLNPFGAHRKGKWVGAPLIVHRRCVEPMFSISNQLAYDGSMVLESQRIREEAARDLREPTFGPSAWINVVGEGTDDFYIPAEGTMAAHIISGHLRCRRSEGCTKLPALFMISPFRKVAAGLKEHLSKNAASIFGDVDASLAEEWIDRSIGTVHTFQGREAETVVLVLGATRPDSIEWALSKPNIINVAVTRAQRRLYVVGNRANWFRNEIRDRWMLGSDSDWVIQEGEGIEMFNSSPVKRPRLRLV